MLIDWFTVCAQVVNFLILVWLLKCFLYKPILLAIDTREKGIADQAALAASKQAEARKQQDDFQRKTAEFDQQRAALLSKAVDEAGAERRKLLDDARKEFDTLRSQQSETMNRERENAGRQMAERACQEVFAIARKTLSDLASASLEERMADVFVQRLRALKPEDRGPLTDALTASPGTALVRSAFDLPQAQRTAIASAIKDTLAVETEVRFETVSDLVSGIELTTQGYKVSWSIADYLGSLEKNMAETLKDDHAS
jgi:F-type H+-transporting ATPase subunit b